MIAAGHLNRELGRVEFGELTAEEAAPQSGESAAFHRLLRRGVECGALPPMPAREWIYLPLPSNAVSVDFAVKAATIAALGGLITGAIIGLALAPLVNVL